MVMSEIVPPCWRDMEVESCKDCEFRYNCLDCRAHTKNGLFGKPITCKYNPFIAKKE